MVMFQICFFMKLLANCFSAVADTFTKFDVDHSGCIDAWELKEAMKSLGQSLSDDELFALLAQVDTARSASTWYF